VQLACLACMFRDRRSKSTQAETVVWDRNFESRSIGFAEQMSCWHGKILCSETSWFLPRCLFVSPSLSKPQHPSYLEMTNEDRSSSSDSGGDGTLSSCPSFFEIKIPSKGHSRDDENTILSFKNICCVGAGYVGMSILLPSPVTDRVSNIA
jgi:hypothetical protein